MPAYDSSTALIVVDVQNDFADPKGSLSVRGGEDVVGVINDEVRRARDAGAIVVYTQDWHPEHTPHFAADGGAWPVHCVRNTWGARLHTDLLVEGETIRKGTGGEDGYSGFTVRDPGSGREHGTELHDLLRERGIKRLVVAGLATDYCVKATAIDGAAKGFQVTVLQKAVRAVDLQPGDGAAAFDAMRRAGVAVE
jgi:nicotinamidase/pyrazinamidase